MLLLAVLDVLLLFWILNPLKAHSSELYPAGSSVALANSLTGEDLKPSPLGSVVKQITAQMVNQRTTRSRALAASRQ
jgi:hypothetical protein